MTTRFMIPVAASLASGVLFCLTAFASPNSGISGSITDNQGIAVSQAQVQIFQNNQLVKQAASSVTGDYLIADLQPGNYRIAVGASGFATYESPLTIGNEAALPFNIELKPEQTKTSSAKEMVLEVKAKRHFISKSSATSSTHIGKDEIATLPQGGEVSLPKLLSSTTPGAVEGAFGQVFFRGNHANIQYQIDGVQLPESPSNTFGQAFSPRNIDHMEVITGGIPAEYGERLAAVINIITKSGPENPGGDVEVNYGSYNSFSPHLLYGGSTKAGDIHYFLSANYNRTDRGLDTPQPESESNQFQGGTEATHDQAYGNNEFAKIDWIADNSNKFSLILFNNEDDFQIPNYPCSFKVTDAFFQPGFTDAFGNGGNPAAPTFNFVPCGTNDRQFEANAYVQGVWRHTFTEHSFLQLGPYYKYSAIRVDNDPTNDLYTSPSGANPVPGSSASSFAENRRVNNLGLKTDYTLRANDRNLVKTGIQFQASQATGSFSIQTDLNGPVFSDSSPNTGYFESAYIQDDFTIAKPLILNAGLRFDATQVLFSGLTTHDSMLQPRIGLNYMVSDTTKLHLFYGRLFQPAAIENLRNAFTTVGGGQLTPFDIKAERDNYFEFGVAQQFTDKQAALLTVYYKNAINMLDDAQLLNTSIAQPFNFAEGYAYGAEISVKGQIANDWSEYVNYSYEIARGSGISGGLFAFPAGEAPGSGFQFLDHVQIHTANAGVTYTKNHLWWTTQGLFGSGLRTGPSNSIGLPSHFTLDTTLGYEFQGSSWWSHFKFSGDVLNVFNNVYPISISNGFNGSHYAAGREFFVRISKDL